MRHGDRVLVVNRTEVPSRMLEAGARAPMALAEVVRLALSGWRLQVPLPSGQLAGPDGVQGFRDIRWLFSHAGGTIPMLAGRIDAFYGSSAKRKEVAPDGIRLRQTLKALRQILAEHHPHLACDPRKL